jgi:hypothetical protein
MRIAAIVKLVSSGESQPMRFVCRLAPMICCLPLLMGAAVYRWVDAGGVVNYTQLKPEGIDAELVSADTGRRIDTPTAPSATGGPVSNGNINEQGLSENQQQMLADLRAAEAARQNEITRVRTANCQEARGVLQRLTSRGRIRVVGDDGVERVMPEDERQDRIAESQRAVVANCSETASR